MRFLRAATIPLILALAGALLILAGRSTPAYSDEPAYRAATEVISQQAMRADLKNSDALSKAFFAAGDRYETAKWPLTDTGASLLAWAALAGLVGIATRGHALSALTRPYGAWPGLLGLTALGLAMLAVGDWEFEMRQLERNQLPWWADSVMIGVFSGWILLAILTPFVLALVLGPALGRRDRPASILVFAPDGLTLRAVMVGLLYGLPILGGLAVAIPIYAPGGWVTSIGAAILGWLFLNAHALMSRGRPQPPVVEPAMAQA